MEFKSSESIASHIGDIEEGSISINAEDVDFVISILSSKLYSDPIGSFIREIVSNAWDSHVEAGVDMPVILEIGEDSEGKYFCRIQDFGVGLSRQRADEVYKKIGTSTKRNDNTQIGGFGLGRFTALLNDSAYITSNFNGTQYKYILYKNGLKTSFDLLYETPTDEVNGVEVLIYLNKPQDTNAYIKAIYDQLTYFENLHFECKLDYYEDKAYDFNNFKIKKYNHFSVNNLTRESKMSLLIGKVKYPIRFDQFPTGAVKATDMSLPISLTFEIGDMEVTPNREEIVYSTETINKIISKIKEARQEINQIGKDQFSKDCTSTHEYIKLINEDKNIILLPDDPRSPFREVSIPSHEDYSITLNSVSHNWRDFKFISQQVNFFNKIQLKNILTGSRISKSSGKTSLNSIKNRYKEYCFCDITSLSTIAKAYLREGNTPYTYLLEPIKDSKVVIKSYLESIRDYNRKSHNVNKLPWDKEIINVLIDYFGNNIQSIPTFTEADVPQSFRDQKLKEAKEDRLLKAKNVVDWKQNINLGTIQKRYGGSEPTPKVQTYSLDSLKTIPKQVIYSDKGDKLLRNLYNIVLQSDVNFVEVAPTKQKLLKDMHQFINLADLMDTKYKVIRRIATAHMLLEEIPELKLLASIKNIESVSRKLYQTIQRLNNYVNEYLYPRTRRTDIEHQMILEMYELCKDENYFDEEVRGLYLANESILKNAKVILAFCNTNRYDDLILEETRINILVDYLLARKLIKPDYEAVVTLKKETIFNIKEEIENEDSTF